MKFDSSPHGREVDMEIRPLRPERRERRRLAAANPAVRERLLYAATELIRQNGWATVRVEDLVRRAGLSVGTFYLYFEGKDDLFVSLVASATERLRRRLGECYASEGTTTERLLRALDVYLDFVAEVEPGFLQFVQAGHVVTTEGPLGQWVLGRHAEDLVPVLEDGMARGELHARDPRLAAHSLVTLVHGVAGFWLAHKDAYSRAQIKDFIITIITSGLASRPADHEGST